MGEKGGAGMIIKYVNSSGASIILNQGHYLVSSHDLRDFAWDRTITKPPVWIRRAGHFLPLGAGKTDLHWHQGPRTVCAERGRIDGLD